MPDSISIAVKIIGSLKARVTLELTFTIARSGEFI